LLGWDEALQQILLFFFAAVSSHVQNRYRCLTTAVSAQSKRRAPVLPAIFSASARARFIFLLYYYVKKIIRNHLWATKTQHNEEKSVGNKL
jgi:hypothetical protein